MLFDFESFENLKTSKLRRWPDTLFIGDGKMHFRKRNYAEALESFTKALDLKPSNEEVLVLRSKCYVQLMEYGLAMEDALQAIIINSNYIEAVWQKGAIEFIIGDFENAYLTFQRGLKKRPNYAKMKYSMIQCQGAILNVIGEGSKLKIKPKDISEVKQRLDMKRGSLKKGGKWNFDLEQPLKCYVDESKLLLHSAEDKALFRELLEMKESLRSFNQYDTSILDKITLGHTFLQERQNFWQMHKPFYARSKHPLTQNLSKQQKLTDQQLKENVSQMPIRDKILYYIKLANNYLRQDNPQECLNICKENLHIIDTVGQYKLQNKAKLTIDILQIMAWAHQDLNEFESATECHEEQKAIAQMNKMDEVLIKVLVNLGRDHMLMHNYEEALRQFDEAIDNDEMGKLKELTLYNCDLLKNISICKFYLKDYKSAKYNGQRALIVAQLLKDKSRQLELLTHLGKIKYAMGGTFEEVTSYYKKALVIAKEIKDLVSKKKLEDYLENIQEIF